MKPVYIKFFIGLYIFPILLDVLFKHNFCNFMGIRTDNYNPQIK